MMTGRERKKARAMLHGAALGIGGGIVDPADSGMGNGASTHRAWLKRDPQVAAVEPLGAENRRGLANRQDFGMGRGIVQCFAGRCAWRRLSRRP